MRLFKRKKDTKDLVADITGSNTYIQPHSSELDDIKDEDENFIEEMEELQRKADEKILEEIKESQRRREEQIMKQLLDLKERAKNKYISKGFSEAEAEKKASDLMKTSLKKFGEEMSVDTGKYESSMGGKSRRKGRKRRNKTRRHRRSRK